MMEFLRERAKGWFAWILFLFIGVPFAFWGINSYFKPSTENAVAKVNDFSISSQQYQTAYQQARQRLQAQLGRNFDPSVLDEQFLKQRVIDQLINEQVLAEAANDAGYSIGVQQLAAEIRKIRQFQSVKGFDPQLYARLLKSQGETTQRFENAVRRSLLIDQLRDTILSSAFVTPAELDKIKNLENQRRTIDYVIVPADHTPVNDKITDEQISAYYEKNNDRFAVPERVKIDYLELKLDDLAKNIKISEERLKTAYEERSQEFMTPEERRASHILISVDKSASPGEKESARHKAQELLDRIHKGEDFSKLAKEYSDDPGSAAHGGDLGFFGRGIMDKAFEEAAFSLHKGEVSDLVESAFGFHIIKLTDIRPGQAKPFDEVRSTLEIDLKREQAKEQFYDKVETMTNLSFENPDTLTPAAEEVGIPVQTSDWFDSDHGTGIASDARIRQAAFSDDVLVDRLNSEPIEMMTDHVVVLRVRDDQPASTKPLDEVRDSIVKQINIEHAREKANELAGQIKDQLEASADEAAQVVAKYNLDWVSGKTVSRTSTDIDPAIVQTAFQMPHPGKKYPLETVQLASGSYAVVRLNEVSEASDTAKDDAGDGKQSAQWMQTIGASELTLFLDNLKAHSKIVRFEDKL